MALEKKTQIDQIIVSKADAVFAREVTTIEEDGRIVSTSYNRLSYIKGCDISNAPDQVKVICNALWEN